MVTVTELAKAQLDPSSKGEVVVELAERDSSDSALVKITWPLVPTVVEAKRFPETAAILSRLFAEAHIALAAIKLRRNVR